MKSKLRPQLMTQLLPTLSTLFVNPNACENLDNSEATVLVLTHRSPTTPPTNTTTLLCTLTKLITHRSDCLLFGNFNCPKIDWTIYSPSPNTVDAPLLDFATESLLHQCVHAPTRFCVNQVPSLPDLLFVKFPNLTSPITVQPPLGKSDNALL